MAWRLARSLTKLREQINEAAPHRDRASDGSIADVRHSKIVSDHNPDSKGRVTAIDVTHDFRHMDGRSLSKSLITDPRTKYVIFDGRIWKARTGKWEKYTGANQHRSHVHLSVTQEGADDDKAWEIGSPETPQTTKPTLRIGDRGIAVELIQCRLGIEQDGVFGYGTQKKVKEFQRQNGLTADGIVGPRSWAMWK